MTQSFDWGEQIFPVPANVLWHATKNAIENCGQQVLGVDDYTMTASIKSKVSWTSWGETTNMQVTTRGSKEAILRVESSSGAITTKTEQNVVLIISLVRDLLVQHSEEWIRQFATEESDTEIADSAIETRLAKLKSLYEKGLIDSEEYEDKKSAILDEL